MTSYRQLSLPFGSGSQSAQAETPYSGRELGTFKDSLRAPIHRWFRYPAGYSFRFVDESLDLFGVTPRDWVYDPFSGTGTTLICAKQKGVNSYGVEAHSFVHWVAQVKLYWDYDYPHLGRAIDAFLKAARKAVFGAASAPAIEGIFPELVYKCYHPSDLEMLHTLRELVTYEIEDSHFQDFLKLALTDTLRGAAAAGTGWPYISPRKNTGSQPPKNAFAVFEKTVWQMYQDLRTVPGNRLPCEVWNVLGDSRREQALEDGQVSLALTSPPYLNNYDYADRTRLETYFWGIASSWGEITEKFRDRLMVAATTQVVRNHHVPETTLSQKILETAPEVYRVVQEAVNRLAELRLTKGGKKDYDLMVALYFSHIFAVLKETHRVLKSGGHFCLVLGDSAPYGVHIETDNLIGQLGLSLGFREYHYYQLRTRGGKWKENPQRHTIPLREGIVILKK